MSVMNMNSRMAMAEKLSVQQLQQAVQAGSLPAYVGVPLMEEKMREQKKAAAMAQLASAQQQAQQYGLPAEKPIAQGVMDQASQQGIANIPSNLPEAGFNDGGIVAFAEGGDAEDFDYEEYQDEQDAEEYNNVLRSYMEQIEAAGLEGIPIHRTKKVEMGVEKKANGGIIGLNAGGLGGDLLDSIDFGAELDRAREMSAAAEEAVKKFGTMGASGNPEDFNAARDALIKAKESEKRLQGQYELNMQNSPETRPATYVDLQRARPTMNGGRYVPPVPNAADVSPSSAVSTLSPVVAPPETTATETTSSVAPNLDSQYMDQDRREGRGLDS